VSYETFVAQPNSSKQTLVEIDIGESLAVFNQEPGIWATKYAVNEASRTFGYGSGCFGFGAYGTGGTSVLGNNNPRSKIGSLWVDGEHLTKRISLANVRANEKSFYFDYANSLIYVGFDNFNPPGTFDFIQAGITHGYSNRSGYMDGVYYDGRVVSLPVVAKRKDPLFYGLLAFEGGTIGLANPDGEFDTFATRNVFGQQVRILFGSPDLAYASCATVFTGYLEDFTLEGGRINIAIQDKRKGLSRTLPIHSFDTATYPDIEDNNIGIGIPIAYGQIRNAPVTCTNEKLVLAGSTGLYYFKLADTSHHPIYAITTVYCEGSSGTMAACTAGNVNLNAATFSLNAEQFEPGRDVTVDFSGYASGGSLIENGLDIIADLMASFAGVSYDSVNYDTTEWAAEQASAETMCLYVDEERELIETIGDICKSIPGIFLVQDDDLYTFKRYNAAKAVDRTIYAQELLGSPLVAYESEEFLTSVLVRYSKDWANDKWQTYIDASRETETFRQYKVRRQQIFETLLLTLSAATIFGNFLMDQADSVEPTFAIVTKTQNIDQELEDIIDAELYVFADGSYGVVRCEVIGIEKNLMDYTVTLTLRRVVEVTANLSTATIIKWEP
jgi:hypothetical protein